MIVFHVILVVGMIRHMENISLNGYFDFDKYERKGEYDGGVSLRNFPTKAVDFLEHHKIKGHFFNDFNSGAYLLGRVYPNIKVFIDGRTELYGPRFFTDYQRISNGDTKLFSQLVDFYMLTGVFLNSVYNPFSQGLLKYLYDSKEWSLVYFDYDATIFLRNIQENQEWIDRYKIDLSTWQTQPVDLLKLGPRPITPYRYINRAKVLFYFGLYDKAQMELNEASRIISTDADIYDWLGRIYLVHNENDKAYENFRLALVLNPHKEKARFYLAQSAYRLNDLRQAEKLCVKLLNNDPKNRDASLLLVLIRIRENRYDEAMQIIKQIVFRRKLGSEQLSEIIDLLSAQGRMAEIKEIRDMIN